MPNPTMFNILPNTMYISRVCSTMLTKFYHNGLRTGAEIKKEDFLGSLPQNTTLTHEILKIAY